jgi:glycosyltransferase involved in cell wall biosynthesis
VKSSLRVLQICGSYFPENGAGTETYVASLVRELAALGIKNVVAAPILGSRPKEYEYECAPVFRYPIGEHRAIAKIRGFERHDYFNVFQTWLRAQKCDIYHQHWWNPGCGLFHLQCAKDLAIPTVMTIHVAGNICMRGTMMRFGIEPCDGRISVKTCSDCWAQSRGIDSLRFLAKMPQDFSALFERNALLGRLGSILATPALVKHHAEQFREMIRNTDCIVAVAKWLENALLLNGVPANKIAVSRQGTDIVTDRERGQQALRNCQRLKIGFLGRWDPAKGIHVLVEAVTRLPSSIPVQLMIHAQEQDKAYETQVRTLAGKDSRIEFRAPVSRNEILSTLRQFDLLAVPSQCFETGPLVVLEAFAAGVPVIGSNLGGIRESVASQINGILLPSADVEAWMHCLKQLTVEQVEKLKKGIGAVRTMRDAAEEMRDIYCKVCK